MKGIQVQKYGGSEVLKYRTDISRPTIQDNQVLAEVHSVGLNPFDIKVLSGAYQQFMPLVFPLTFGGDMAGIVVEVGKDVSGLQVGDKVFGSAIVIKGGSGALAEFATVGRDSFSLMPKNTNYNEAAALPVSGLTAVEAIADQIKLQKGQKILIHGGAGGVGHFAIQYAKSRGAYVATTVGKGDFGFVKDLGADKIIDYKTEKFENILQDCDGVLDTIGGEVSEASYKVLKQKGVLVLLAGQVDEELAQKYGVKAIQQQTKTDSLKLKRLADLVEQGILKVHIDRVFPLNQTKEAFLQLQSGHPKGKVVVQIKP